MKYTRPEIERRWLVRLDEVGSLDGLPRRDIDDLYVSGTRLRVRKITGPDGGAVFKLGKKYGKQGGLSEPATNLYLEEPEYRLLCSLGGAEARKVRYSIAGGALDIYVVPPAGLAIFEAEFENEAEARAYTPPPFVREEITDDPRYSGWKLANPEA